MAIAFKAVKQCEADVKKLLNDLDGEMEKEGWTCLLKADQSRFYKNDQVSNTIDGIDIHFFGDLQEPLLIVGRAVYQVPTDKRLEDVWYRWDLTTGYHKSVKEGAEPFLKAVPIPDLVNKRITLRAADLYSIHNMEAVLNLFSEVRSSTSPV